MLPFLFCVSSAFFAHLDCCPCCLTHVKKILNLLQHLLFGMSTVIIDPDHARKSHFIFKSYFEPAKLQQQSDPKPWAPSAKLHLMPQVHSRFYLIYLSLRCRDTRCHNAFTFFPKKSLVLFVREYHMFRNPCSLYFKHCIDLKEMYVFFIYN